MKTSKIFLHKWPSNSSDDYIDIPWPQVHQAVGSDTITWLRDRDPTQVQLILEKAADGSHELYADFYSPALRNEFALTFAK
jgi:hypothetical protein